MKVWVILIAVAVGVAAFVTREYWYDCISDVGCYAIKKPY